MRRGLFAIPLAVSLGVLAFALLAYRGDTRGAIDGAPDATPAALPGGQVSLLLMLGLNDAEPSAWDGAMSVSAGSVASLEFFPAGRRIEGTRWSLRTSRAVAKAKAKVKKAAAPVAPVQLLARVEAPATASVEIETPRGRFAFRVDEISIGTRKTFLEGAARVERLPTSVRLTDSPQDDDVPASAVAPDGTVWCAYVAYEHGTPVVADDVAHGRFDSLVTRGNGDRIRLFGYTGGAFTAPVDVTQGGLDVWRPAVAVDSQGTVWVLWSQNVDGNWDLHARAYSPSTRTWGDVRRITSAPGPDLNVVAGGGGPAGVWVAWQGWRSDNFEILLARLEKDGTLRERTVSTSRANDWDPTLAVSTTGDVWVAWDTYDAGNYDIYARRLAGDRFDDPIAVAASPRFEARPSLILDAENRPWIAFEDADPNWGKDYGSRFPGRQGVPFYLERNIVVRRIEGTQVRQSMAAVKSELIDTHYDDTKHPKERRHRISIPRLARDGKGTVWLFYRRHPRTTGEGEHWVSFAMYADGDQWSPTVRLPRSDNLLDNRPALAALKDGELLAIYSSDARTSAAPSAKVNDLYAARLAVSSVPKALEFAAVDPKGDGRPVEPMHPDENKQVEAIRSYRITTARGNYRLLRGDFHRHTEISSHRDWDGPMEDLWRYGLDVASHDWIGSTDHEYAMVRDYPWWISQKQSDLYHLPSRFMPMFTFERSLPYPTGHRNVMFAKRGVRLLPALEGQPLRFGTAERGAPDIKNLYAYLKQFDGLCSSHTSATSMGTDWRDNDPAVEPVVEIIQGHRQNYEEPKAPQAAKAADDSIQGYEPAGFVWQALAKGYKLGFQSSSDHVSTHLSYAVVLAEEPSRAGILAALKKRHSYAAQDNIILDVRCGDFIMGDELTVKSAPQLDIRVIGTAPVARLDIVRQSGGALPVYVFSAEPKRNDVKLRWTDEAAKPGETAMYYVRVMQDDAKLAWASPFWITYAR